jgi:NAD(P)-dependent dehydrogenase (short-subunit alcohol dehydrogenase family)
MRLKDRVAIVVGAGQSPGEGIGNGRATALTFAREGAKVLCVDRNLASAKETVDMIGAKGGTAVAFQADVTKNAELKAMVDDARSRWGRIDILHNNVGAAIRSCSTSPRRRSTAVSRSTSRAAFSPPST